MRSATVLSAAAQVGECIAELQQVPSHTQRHTGLGIRGTDTVKITLTSCAGSNADLNWRGLILGNGCTLLEGLVHAIQSIGDKVMSSAAQTQDLKTPG